MKIWVETNIVGAGTEEDPKHPDLSPHDRDPELRYSMMDKGDGTCLARVAGPRAKIMALTPKMIDEEARAIIKDRYPNSDIYNVDVPDPELNDMAKTLGIDPLEVRSKAKVDTLFALHSQEVALLEEVAKRKGVDISAHVKRIREGRCNEHEKAMKKLR